MISSILSIPVMLIFTVFQTVAISRINLLSGSADIVLLAIVSWGISKKDSSIFFWALFGGFLISYISAMPAPATITSYLIIAIITWIVQKRFWQSPILSILISSLIGTVIKFLIDVISLQFIDIQFDFPMSVRMTLAPNLILNLFFLFPVFLVINDMAKLISPKEAYEDQ